MPTFCGVKSLDSSFSGTAIATRALARYGDILNLYVRGCVHVHTHTYAHVNLPL